MSFEDFGADITQWWVDFVGNLGGGVQQVIQSTNPFAFIAPIPTALIGSLGRGIGQPFRGVDDQAAQISSAVMTLIGAAVLAYVVKKVA